MKRYFTFITIIGFIFTLSACQTIPYQGKARDIKLKPKREGILGLPLNPRVEDRNVASSKMKMNCSPGKYEVLEEGEVVIGQKTNSNSRANDRKSSEYKVGSLFGIPVTSGDPGGQDTSSTEVTTQLKEWQISYKCLSNNSSRKRKSKLR